MRRKSRCVVEKRPLTMTAPRAVQCANNNQLILNQQKNKNKVFAHQERTKEMRRSLFLGTLAVNALLPLYFREFYLIKNHQKIVKFVMHILVSIYKLYMPWLVSILLFLSFMSVCATSLLILFWNEPTDQQIIRSYKQPT